MSTSKILELVGLFLNVVGAIFLTYDFFYGPGYRFQAENRRRQLDILRESHKRLQDTTRGLPITEEAKEKMITDDEAKHHFAERERKILADIKYLEDFPDRSQNIGIIGVLLLLVGFLSEFLGVALRHEL